MSLAFSSLAIATGVGVVVATGHNGFIDQMPMQVCSQGVSRGYSSLDIILNVKEFDSACTWLEQKTLIGYFVGRTPSESMLQEWVTKIWTPQGVHLEGVQSLTKDFFLFSVSNVGQAEHVFIQGP